MPARLTCPLPAAALRTAMTDWVGLERDDGSLRQALGTITSIERAAGGEPSLLNMTAAAKLVAAAALARRESIGAHFRRDYPHAGDTKQRQFLTLADAEAIAREAAIEPAPLRRDTR